MFVMMMTTTTTTKMKMMMMTERVHDKSMGRVKVISVELMNFMQMEVMILMD